MKQLSIMPVVNKITYLIQNWENKTLGTREKILMCSSLIASLLLYRLQALPNLPEKLLKKI